MISNVKVSEMRNNLLTILKICMKTVKRAPVIMKYNHMNGHSHEYNKINIIHDILPFSSASRENGAKINEIFQNTYFFQLQKTMIYLIINFSKNNSYEANVRYVNRYKTL